MLVLTAVLAGDLEELHHCDTCLRVFSHPCAELGCFPYNWHRTRQTQEGLGLTLLCVGLCHPRWRQASKAPAWLLFKGASGCVRNCYNKKTLY